MKASGYEAFDRQGQIFKNSWTPRKGNEILIKFHSGVQKRGFISESPVTCGNFFANPVVIPSGSSRFSTGLKFRLFPFGNQREPFVLLKLRPWPSALQPRTKVKWTQKEQVISLTFGHQKNVKHLRVIPQIQVRFHLCWTFGAISGNFTNCTNWPAWSHCWQGGSLADFYLTVCKDQNPSFQPGGKRF